MEWRKPEPLMAADRKSLREEARAAFDGQKLLTSPRWGFEIACFRLAIGSTGDLLHLPVDGGAFEQPLKAMEIMAILQEEYRREKKGVKR